MASATAVSDPQSPAIRAIVAAMTGFDQRPGEIAVPFDPAVTAADASVVFIGRIRSPWRTRDDCPKNLREARERGQAATVEIDQPWRPGLAGLEAWSHAVLLYWMHEARRDLVVQTPRHKPVPQGVFSLRSPARPNPIALATVRILSIDRDAGRIVIDAIDCVDGTALVDLKPWIETVDAVATDVVARAATIVAVADVAASVAFYCDVLGFECRDRAADGGFALVVRGPAAVQLLRTDDPGALKATSENVAVYLYVTGVDALYDRLKPGLDTLPRRRVRAPFDQDYGMREFHVKDPDGCLLFFGEPIAAA